MQNLIEASEETNLRVIKKALDINLFVPTIRLKPNIVNELIEYVKERFSHENYKIKVFLAFSESGELQGSVVCQLDPDYTSYGRKCATFGWLNAKNFEACEILMKKCEEFAKMSKTRKIRGPINFPKALGGVGYQTEGFDQRLLYGVAYSDPKSEMANYLNRLGYETESEYSCLRVTEKTWEKGVKIDKNVKFRFFELKELMNMKEKMLDLAKQSFHSLLPDTSGGEHRLDELFHVYSELSNGGYNRDKIDLKLLSDVPEFVEALESCDLKKVEVMMPMAFNRESNELVGMLIGIPDLYQHWLGEPVTRCNVDTAMVKKGFDGKGVFSALNNIGQVLGATYGLTYLEGTGIWTSNSKDLNNENAIKTIFPHCELIRKHVVVEKRL